MIRIEVNSLLFMSYFIAYIPLIVSFNDMINRPKMMRIIVKKILIFLIEKFYFFSKI